MSAVCALVLYTDDAVEVRYRDGARLFLSPCGTEFMYERPQTGGHPVQRPERGRHRTEFVTSSCRQPITAQLSLYQSTRRNESCTVIGCYGQLLLLDILINEKIAEEDFRDSKDQVLQALNFRNTFSSCPFLPSSLVPSEEITTLLTEISEVTWPALEDDAGCVIHLEDGSVTVSSLDGHAHLYMTALQKEVTVKFLCQLSCTPCAPGTPTYNDVNTDPKPAGIKTTRNMNWSKYSSCAPQEQSLPCHTKHASCYTWLEQRFSVADCPPSFQYPMGLALHIHQPSARQKSVTTEETTDSDFPQTKAVSTLPGALPLTCSAAHLHRMSFCKFSIEEENMLAANPSPLKVVICNGVLYRFILDRANLVEIYPGDGSVFISEGDCMGKYFKHFFIKDDNKQIEDRLYTARDLPPDKPRALYSVRSVISQARRFLESCCQHKLSMSPLSHTCCWKRESGPDSRAVVPVLLEQSFIPNQGRFAVYSNNTVCASYMDGVLLYTIWNFANFNKNEECPDSTTIHKSSSAARHDQFGWFSLRFPDGSSKLIEMEDPGEYASYIRTAVTWCQLLDEKSLGEMLTPITMETEMVKGYETVAHELEKIQRFNFLLENSSARSHRNNIKLPGRPDNTDGARDEISKMNIQSILEKTSKAIRDIDSLLSSRK